MSWDLNEAVQYYKKQGAPGDQNALISLLREVQEEFSSIPKHLLPEISEKLGVKENFLLALIRRQPRLRLGDSHTLELCAGPNCGKRTDLAALAEQLCAGRSDVQLKFVPCMRQCGKGPNLKWDGEIHNRVDEALLRSLFLGKITGKPDKICYTDNGDFVTENPGKFRYDKATKEKQGGQKYVCYHHQQG